MRKYLSPCCLLLALVMFVATFAIVTIGRPGPSLELHRARVNAADLYRELLELQLIRERRRRIILIVSLFALGLLSAVGAFVTMPSRAS